METLELKLTRQRDTNCPTHLAAATDFERLVARQRGHDSTSDGSNIARPAYDGDVFYRARDLIDRMYEENDQEIYDSFLDSGHPSEGD